MCHCQWWPQCPDMTSQCLVLSARSRGNVSHMTSSRWRGILNWARREVTAGLIRFDFYSHSGLIRIVATICSCLLVRHPRIFNSCLSPSENTDISFPRSYRGVSRQSCLQSSRLWISDFVTIFVPWPTFRGGLQQTSIYLTDLASLTTSPSFIYNYGIGHHQFGHGQWSRGGRVARQWHGRSTHQGFGPERLLLWSGTSENSHLPRRQRSIVQNKKWNCQDWLFGKSSVFGFAVSYGLESGYIFVLWIVTVLAVHLLHGHVATWGGGILGQCPPNFVYARQIFPARSSVWNTRFLWKIYIVFAPSKSSVASPLKNCVSGYGSVFA